MNLVFKFTIFIACTWLASTFACAQSNSASSATSRAALAQNPSIVKVEINEDLIRCFDSTIRIKDVATVSHSQRQLAATLMELDLDVFKVPKTADESPQQVTITKRQIEFRMILAGVEADRLRVTGPNKFVVVAALASDTRGSIARQIRHQLAEQFVISNEDLQVTLDEKFSEFESGEYDFSDFRIVPTLLSDIPLGRQQISVVVRDKSGQSVSRRVPVTIALIRDLVVAKANISKGQTLSAENVETVRRPIVNRNVRFASFEQVIGKQVQSDIQQYELLKSNAVSNRQSRSNFVIKKNAIVSVIVRSGALKVVLKDVKALDSGNIGDRIVLQNSKTKERIFAIVIDASTAEARF